MNIAEALDAALPEIVAKRATPRLPKLEPKIIAREHIEEGVPTVLALIPGEDSLFRVAPHHWRLFQMFDGDSTHEQIAERWTLESGVPTTAEEIRELADQLDSNGLLYRPLAEKHIALTQDQAKERRHRRKKINFGDFTEIQFTAWNPDSFLTKAYQKLSFVYAPWFTLLTLCLWAFMVYVFASRLGEIWKDTIAYYTFTDKSVADLAEFWLLFGVLIFFHEAAHGLTTKHYGGGVPRMGFMLMYLAPCFFCDTSQAWIYGRKWQRILTMASGIWVEMIITSIATIVWWGTVPGMWVHDFAYKIMLLNGIMVLLLNLNPLLKLDGYFIFGELVGIADIKEKSTTYISGWMKKHLCGLPVEVDWVPRRRRPLYVFYALAAGAYSYTMLFFVVRLTYNIAHSYTPEWAFVPALGACYVVFKNRIWTFLRFMKTVYLDKRERLRGWLQGPRLAVVVGVVALVLFAPVWHESIAGRFNLEAARQAVVRTSLPGTVTDVYADEGDLVQAGAPLVKLRNRSWNPRRPGRRPISSWLLRAPSKRNRGTPTMAPRRPSALKPVSVIAACPIRFRSWKW